MFSFMQTPFNIHVTGNAAGVAIEDLKGIIEANRTDTLNVWTWAGMIPTCASFNPDEDADLTIHMDRVRANSFEATINGERKILGCIDRELWQDISK